MDENGKKRTNFKFGEFKLNAEERMLARGAERIPLSPRVFDLLAILVENQGKLVTKEKLLEDVWADSVVEEGNINRTISTLRKKLGTQENGSDFIETVPRAGYRFIAPVSEIEEDRSEKKAEPTRRTSYGIFALAALSILLLGAVAAAGYLWRRGGVEPGGLTNLTNDLAEDTYPEFSPDGRKILFTSNRNGMSHIFVMERDGGNVTELTSPGASDHTPAWSPAGDRIVFDRSIEQNREIFIMNADGSGQKRLTFNPTVDGGPPRFSPDGMRIAFARAASGEGQGQYNLDIFTMNTDGGDLKQLTMDAEYDAGPVFSPDGSKIAFLSGRDGSFDVFMMNSDGSGQVNLTKTPELNDTPIGWTPDGKQLLFNRNSTSQPDIFQVWIMGSDGSNPRQISSFTENALGTTYSAAAGSFTFFSKKNGNMEIYKAEAPDFSGN